MSVSVDDKNSSQYIIEVCTNKGRTFKICWLWNTDDFYLSEWVSVQSQKVALNYLIAFFIFVGFFFFSYFLIMILAVKIFFIESKEDKALYGQNDQFRVFFIT